MSMSSLRCIALMVTTGLVVAASILTGPIPGVLPTPALALGVAKNKAAKNKNQIPTFLWDETQPGCTFSETPDGKYNYGISSNDLSVALSVDAREVQLVHHRIEPIFGVLLTIRYRGDDHLDAASEGISLQFLKHFKVIEPAIDPDDYTDKIQADVDALNDETRRFVEKHPDQKQARETRLQDYEKSVAELMEFLAKDSLRPARLDRSRPAAGGWVFFNTANKWIGGWKPQEEFMLRVPLGGKLFVFSFKLPPKKGEVLLRKRE